MRKYDHGQAHRLARRLLHANRWTSKHTLRLRLLQQLPPEYFGRRYEPKRFTSLDACKTKMFAELILSLEIAGHIERRWPGGKKSNRAAWEARLTAAGSKLKKMEAGITVMPGSVTPTLSKWTRETVVAEALRFRTRNEWSEHSRRSYNAAKNNGWFTEATAHMGPSWPNRHVKAVQISAIVPRGTPEPGMAA